MEGRVHGFETLGARDGPGVRTVVFLQGCPLRCDYCHNPETWDPADGRAMAAAEVVDRVARNRPYFGKRGGVTLSGGEPLCQAAFGAAIFAGCRALGIHTALDTSGALGVGSAVPALLAVTDLVLLDLKAPDEESHRALTGAPLAPVLRFLAEVAGRAIPLWVRHVVVPGRNDTPEQVAALARPLAGLDTLVRVELLPYHTLAAPKYAALGRAHPLADVPALPEAALPPLVAALRHALPQAEVHGAAAPAGPCGTPC